jgi:hypothetical protein
LSSWDAPSAEEDDGANAPATESGTDKTSGLQKISRDATSDFGADVASDVEDLLAGLEPKKPKDRLPRSKSEIENLLADLEPVRPNLADSSGESDVDDLLSGLEELQSKPRVLHTEQDVDQLFSQQLDPKSIRAPQVERNSTSAYGDSDLPPSKNKAARKFYTANNSLEGLEGGEPETFSSQPSLNFDQKTPQQPAPRSMPQRPAWAEAADVDTTNLDRFGPTPSYEHHQEYKPKCTVCLNELEPGSRFCGECGNVAPKIPACHLCGSPLEPSSKFCGECGSPRVDEGVSEQAHEGVPPIDSPEYKAFLKSQEKPTQKNWVVKLLKFLEQ